MKTYSILICLIILCNVLRAQKPTTIAPYKDQYGWYVFKNKGSSIMLNDITTRYMSDIGLGTDDKLIPADFDKKSGGINVDVRYKHYYKGYEVDYSMIVAHTQKNDSSVEMFSGKVVSGLKLNTNPTILEKNALQIALTSINALEYAWQNTTLENDLKIIKEDTTATYYPKGKLVIANHTGGELIASNYAFVWEFFIKATNPNKIYRALINAVTGTVYEIQIPAQAEKYENGSVQTLYYGYRTNELETSRCTFCSNWTLYDSRHINTTLAGNPLRDNDNIWSDVNERPATTAHWVAGKVWDYFNNTWGRKGYDGKGTTLFVDAGYSTANDTYYSAGTIFLGKESNGNWHSAVDIIAHEFTHGVTTSSANLIYSKESGALNESFSDIFGTLAERYIKTNIGQQWNWTLGEDVNLIRRSMSNPNAYSQPDYYGKSPWANINDVKDNGGVHTNSGVQNKWFYLLSLPEYIGVDKAATIAFQTLTNYLWSSANYLDAKIASVNVAIKLYGECSNEAIKTYLAWNQVGVLGGITGSCYNDIRTVNPIENIQLTIYPNPANNYLNISMALPVKNSEITIVNSLGQLKQSFIFTGTDEIIDITNFHSGIYIINIKTDKSNFTGKFQVVK